MTDATLTKARRARWRDQLAGLQRMASGIGAVGAKELRGRMRGRRAFVILTIYLLLLGGFAWMIELILERNASSGNSRRPLTFHR